jgi:hypothetical protein
VDDSGRVHICGEYAGAGFDPGGGALPFAGETDLFLASYESDGTHLFSVGFGGPGTEACEDIAVDADGNYYLTGNFSSAQLNLGEGTIVNAKEGGGGWDQADGFAAKLTSTGLHVWSVHIGGDSWDDSIALALAADNSLYVTGMYDSYFATIGDLELPKESPTLNMYVARVDQAGDVAWVRCIEGSGRPWPEGLAVGTGGSVVATGAYMGTVFGFGDGPLPNIGAGDKTDIFVAAYAADGESLWAHGFGGSDDDSGESIAVGPGGSVFVGGHLATANVQFTDSVVAQSSGGFVLKLDSEGESVWVSEFVNFSGKHPQAISVDANGLYVGANSSLFNSVANLVRLNEDGSQDWRLEFDGTASDSIFGLGVDGEGAIFVGITSSSQALSLGGDTFTQAQSFTTSFVALGAFSL